MEGKETTTIYFLIFSIERSSRKKYTLYHCIIVKLLLQNDLRYNTINEPLFEIFLND